MTTQSQQQQMAQPHQQRATTNTLGNNTQGGATDTHEEFCGGACGAGAGAAVIWRPITVETRR
ncbi:hypothetical protein TSH100_29915 [Azospirillum sp. TSH100]|uniref:hypothetical protein n=1 Tax=Azospirillum sp. TSH100 TaxID=652764 RepID=UPI000D61DDBA|nr:hypothetical protein [Azospirillum sp. TSH100]PWC80315.1 hypothetical protein TSH100_29915 [Azospirillum sp. TSH100]QCG91934.1 hypothetical protein E6C72_29595 [Azospirillum sp. TSH100]